MCLLRACSEAEITMLAEGVGGGGRSTSLALASNVGFSSKVCTRTRSRSFPASKVWFGTIPLQNTLGEVFPKTQKVSGLPFQQKVALRPPNEPEVQAHDAPLFDNVRPGPVCRLRLNGFRTGAPWTIPQQAADPKHVKVNAQPSMGMQNQKVKYIFGVPHIHAPRKQELSKIFRQDF